MFLNNNTQNVLKKLFANPFQKKKNQNWVYLWINGVKFYKACFYCILIWGPSKYSETKLQTNCFYDICRFFKNKKGSRSLPGSFSAWVSKKKTFLLLYIFYNCNLVPRAILRKVVNFEIKSQDKNLYILGTKRAFNMMK